MLIAILGEDSYLARTAIDKIKEKYLEKNPQGVELITIDCDESERTNWADLVAAPLFAQSRLIIIKRLASLTKVVRGELSYFFSRLPATTVIVAWEDKVIDDTLGRTLAQADKVIGAQPLRGAKLSRWLEKTAKDKGVSLRPGERDELLNHYGNNLWALLTHLEQRALSDKVSLVGEGVIEEEPFRIFRLARTKQWSQLAKQICQDFERGAPYELIVGSLAAALRKLPQPNDYATLVSFLFDLDLAVKTGLIDSTSAVTLIAVNLPHVNQSSVQWKLVYYELYA